MPSLEQLAELVRASINTAASDHWVNVGSEEWNAIEKAKNDYCAAVINSEEVILALIGVAKSALGEAGYPSIDEALCNLEALCPSS